jgi:zinc and cadmium transporter
MPTVLLAYYCALILVASIVGGMIPVWFQLTHRWMQFAVSFVAGVMLGIGVLHMLPHAIANATAAANVEAAADASTGLTAAASNATTIHWIMISLLAGMLAMFFIERFFSYHHHDVPEEDLERESLHEYQHSHDHVTNTEDKVSGVGCQVSRSEGAGHHEHHHHSPSHDLSWSGAALGLALHSMLNGIALAAAVGHGSDGSWLAGFGTFLVIFLHKPFDAMTIGMLMARGGWSMRWRHTVNALFAMAIPLGVLIFNFGLMSESASATTAARQWYLACALAFSAGTFLCISLSDLLPELQFHRHDRVKLSAALLLGLAVAHVASQMEAAAHQAHVHSPATGAIHPSGRN